VGLQGPGERTGPCRRLRGARRQKTGRSSCDRDLKAAIEKGCGRVNLESATQAVDAYLADAGESEAARLRFFLGLWEVQAAIKVSEGSYEPITPEAAIEVLSSGRHIFQVNSPEILRDEYLDAVSRVVRYVIDMAGLPKEQPVELEAVDFATAIDEERLAVAASSPSEFLASVVEALADSLDRGGLTSTTLLFVLASALTPFLEEASTLSTEALDFAARQAARTTTCPICGSAPAVSHVGESKKHRGAARTLWCSMCHAEWEFDRIQCAMCGTRSHGNLRYAHVEGDAAHRLHLCDECNGYIRAVFRGETTKPLNMMVEDVVMAGLEVIAIDQGYTAEAQLASDRQ